jgi:hypothetical protein
MTDRQVEQAAELYRAGHLLAKLGHCYNVDSLSLVVSERSSIRRRLRRARNATTHPQPVKEVSRS